MRTFLLLVCLGSVALHAQTLTVRDRETGSPLEMATITSEVPRASTTTNARGQADISAFKGSGRIEVRFLGYRTEARSFGELAESSFLLELSPSVISLDQVVVSATRWSRATADLPARILTVTPGTLFLRNPQTSADLLGASGEVFVQKSQQGGGSPMIRGFATNRLLYSVDGVRMNTAIFRAGNLQNVISLDPFATERTEILFGPGSVIYGSDAIGGVMSFQTLVPRFSLSDQPFLSGNAVARTSSANTEHTGHLDVTVGWRQWSLLTSFSSFEFGDLLMGQHGPAEYLRPFFVQRQDSIDVVVTNDQPLLQKPTGYRQINLMQKVGYRPVEDVELVYGFHYSTTSDYSRYDRHIRYRNGLPRSAEWYYGPQIWMMNNVTVLMKKATDFSDEMVFRLAHQFFEESRVDRDMNDNERRSRVEHVNAYSLNFDLTADLDGGDKLSYGAEIVWDDVRSSGTDEDISTGKIVPGPARYPRATWKSLALYGTLQKRFSETLLGEAGLRYNSYGLDARFDTTFYPFPYTKADISSGAVTGSAGLVYHPEENWSFSLNLSTGFRSPNVDDAGKVFDSEPGSVVVPNPDLRAEYAYNAEVGAATIMGEVLRIDLAAYYTLLSDAMVRRDFRLNGKDSIIYDGTLSRVQAVQNAARARVYGIQAGMELRLPSGFGLSCHLNVQKGEEELDDGSTSPSRHAAPAFGSVHLTYDRDKTTLDLSTEFQARKPFSEMPEEERGKNYLYAIDSRGRPYSPSWYTLNMNVQVRLTEQLSVSGGVENITDQRYRPYSSGIAGPGRNVVLALKTVF